MSGSTSGANANGFRVSNGQILDPNGNAFTARGVNVFDDEMGQAITSSSATPLLGQFPGLNMVRLNCFSYNAPSYYANFISQLTSKGIVVEIEDHTTSTGSNGGGSVGVAYTGQALANESNWYANLASTYSNNPFVWFGTMNEPPNQSQGALTAQEIATYDAIRGAGNSNPIMMEVLGGSDVFALGANNPQGLWPDSAYARMSNIVWDLHQYDWVSNYSTDASTISSALANCVSLVQQVQSADGLVPILIGEYGVSTNGTDPDAGGMQLAQTVQQSGYGALAFNWNPDGGPNALTNWDGSLTTYGQEVAGRIASGGNSSPLAASASVPTATSTPSPDTFPLDAAGGSQATLGSTPTSVAFLGSPDANPGDGTAGATVAATGGQSTVTAGPGPLDVTGGAQATNYVFQAGDGSLTVEDFSAVKGDTLMVDSNLQGSLQTTSDGAGGTLISFGDMSSIDLRGVASAPDIKWS